MAGLRVTPSKTTMPDKPPRWHDNPVLVRAFQTTVSNLITCLDRGTVLDRIEAALYHLFPDEIVEVWLVEDAVATLQRSYGYDEQRRKALKPIRVAIEEAPTFQEAVETGSSVHHQDTTIVAEHLEHPPTIRACVTTPLIHGGAPAGLVSVASTTPNALSGDRVQLLAALAPIAAQSLQNADRYAAEQQAKQEAQAKAEALQRQCDQLMALTNIDRQILTMSDSPEGVMRAILDHALTLMHLEKGVIVLVRENGEPEFIHGRGIKNMAATQRLIMTYWAKEHAVHQKQGPNSCVAVNRIREMPERFAAWAKQEDIRALLTVPLWIRESLVGRITLLDTRFRAWTDKEQEMAQMLANQAAIAVDKAILTQRLRRRLHEAEVLNRALQATNPSLDPEDMLSSICRETQNVLNVPWVAAGIVEGHYLHRIAEARDPAFAPLSWDKVDLRKVPALQRALDNQKMLIFEKVREEAPELAQQLLKDGDHSAIFVPLTLRDSGPDDVTTAVLCTEVAHDYRTETFSQDDVRLVQLIAAAVTPTLESARLFREVEHARAQVEEAYIQLQRQDEVKSQFIQNVSHELRTPLAIVKGYTDLMVEGEFNQHQDPILSQAVEALHTQTDNLVRLVEAITTLDHMVEISALDTVPQSIEPLCQASIKTHWQKALRRKMEILPEIQPPLPPVDLDRPQMLRALNHVLDNALKFNREGGKIWMRAYAREGYVWIEVEDEGIGLPKAELDRIFDRFYQVNGTSTRRHGGMGLGLSVVREVVTRHKGRVWASSDGESLGTTITIKLPIYEAEEAS